MWLETSERIGLWSSSEKAECLSNYDWLYFIWYKDRKKKVVETSENQIFFKIKIGNYKLVQGEKKLYPFLSYFLRKIVLKIDQVHQKLSITFILVYLLTLRMVGFLWSGERGLLSQNIALASTVPFLYCFIK